MAEHNTHESWMLSCPCNDGNFKSHLKAATINDIKNVLDQLSEKGNKTKIKVLTSELRNRYEKGR